MQMNPDLADDWAGAIKKLKVGQELCIIPDVCPSEAEWEQPRQREAQRANSWENKEDIEDIEKQAGISN